HTAPIPIYPLSLHDALPIFEHLAQVVHDLDEAAEPGGGFAADGGDLVHLAGGGEQRQLARLGIRLQMIQRRFADAARRLVDDAQDRKSTRLNSSHVSISYAV